MSSFNRGIRTATRNLRLPALQSRGPRTSLAFTASITKLGASVRPTVAKFSTMSPLQSGAPPPAQPREYDPEIKDIASYVHNTPIDSALAVSELLAIDPLQYSLTFSGSSTPPDSSSLTHSDVVLRLFDSRNAQNSLAQLLREPLCQMEPWSQEPHSNLIP